MHQRYEFKITLSYIEKCIFNSLNGILFYHKKIRVQQTTIEENYDLDSLIKSSVRSQSMLRLWALILFHPHTCRVAFDWILLLPLSIISFGFLSPASLSSHAANTRREMLPSLIISSLTSSLTYANILTFNIEYGENYHNPEDMHFPTFSA